MNGLVEHARHPGHPEHPVDVERARAVASQVPDPEVPVLTVADLGILRDVAVDGGRVRVTITPTYSGCPAVGTIREDITTRLAEAGYRDVEVVTTLSPAWTTDWMSEDGRRKLAEYGIAPPQRRPGGAVALTLSLRCPRCGSPRTRELNRFGSTACKSLWVCGDCAEPFDHFKDH
ncbi:1,2-phenylacetyl-CoA epoxidase subunit PaaD [Kineococcus auxinigenes]|uniref:1,2-phenylacetyl-CoA epoxidase subunit PaaD n=1 Tax=unclassified Kineococcus TaxID=2621656 RepID=UPI003D7ECF73